jgi:hypothetical protein
MVRKSSPGNRQRAAPSPPATWCSLPPYSGAPAKISTPPGVPVASSPGPAMKGLIRLLAQKAVDNLLSGAVREPTDEELEQLQAAAAAARADVQERTELCTRIEGGKIIRYKRFRIQP